MYQAIVISQSGRNWMKVSFAACQDIPTYDPIANKQLGEILQNARKCSFEDVTLD